MKRILLLLLFEVEDELELFIKVKRNTKIYKNYRGLNSLIYFKKYVQFTFTKIKMMIKKVRKFIDHGHSYVPVKHLCPPNGLNCPQEANSLRS